MSRYPRSCESWMHCYLQAQLRGGLQCQPNSDWTPVELISCVFCFTHDTEYTSENATSMLCTVSAAATHRMLRPHMWQALLIASVKFAIYQRFFISSNPYFAGSLGLAGSLRTFTKPCTIPCMLYAAIQVQLMSFMN